MLTEVVSMHSY